MKAKFFVFDVGNVCYPYSLKPLNDLCHHCSEEPDLFEEKGGIKSFDFKPFMLGKQTFPQFCRALCEHCFFDYSASIQNDIDVALHAGVGDFYKETLAAMDFLRKQNIKLCLLSNALPNLSGTASKLVLRRRIFVSYRLGLLKPDIKIYQKVLERLQVPPEAVVFVDDKPVNVQAAQTLGIHGIVFQKETILDDVRKFI